MNSPDDFRNHVQDPEELELETDTDTRFDAELQRSEKRFREKKKAMKVTLEVDLKDEESGSAEEVVEKPKTEKPRTERPRTEKPKMEKSKMEKSKMENQPGSALNRGEPGAEPRRAEEENFAGQTGSAKDLIVTACIFCVLLCVVCCVCVIILASRKSAAPPVFPSPSSTLPRGAGSQGEAEVEAFANAGETGAKASANLLQDIVAMVDENAKKTEKNKAGKSKKAKEKDAQPKDVKPEPRRESVSPAVPVASSAPRISSPPSSPSPRDEGLGSASFKSTLQKKAAEREARLEDETTGAETTERRRGPPRSMANRRSTEEARREDGLAREALERAERFREEAAREYMKAKKAAPKKNPAKGSENASEHGAAALAVQGTGASPR